MIKTNDVKSNTPDSPNDIGQQTKSDSSSFLDSIFLSSTALIIMTSFVVVAIVIMGWFVFEYASNKNWIDSHDQLIESARKANDELMELKDTIPVFEATKNRLLLEAESAQEALSRDQVRLNTVQAEYSEGIATLRTLQEQIADAEERRTEALRLVPEAEQRITTLRAQQQQLNTDIQAKRSEFSGLDGEVRAVTQQITELNLRLNTITNVESDFSQIQNQLSAAATQLETTNSRVLNS